MAKKDKESKASIGGSNKNLLIYVAAFGALLLVLVYVLVYQKLVTNAESISASNRTLSVRVNELKQYYDAREQYLADTQTLEQLIDELLAQYPADAREEDAIMLAVQMEQNSEAKFLTVNMEKGDAVKVIPAETVTAAENEKYTQELQFREMSATYVNEVSYAGLKKLIQTVYDSSNRIGIQNISYSKGDAENPNLSGHIDLVFYSVTGTDKEYAAPDIIPYLAGTNNIFGEIVIPEEPENTEESEDTGEETESAEGGENNEGAEGTQAQ